MPAQQEFVALVTTVVGRFYVQNGRNVVPADAGRMAGRLFELILERGLPPPLREGDYGKPGGMADEICAPLVERILAGSDDGLLAEAARQLVKACFYPEFKVCRDSYLAADPEGRCRRQDLVRVRGRVSGSHCVDCPYWVTLDDAAHEQLLAAAWRGDRSALTGHRDVFLPEDFRALRQWLYTQARR